MLTWQQAKDPKLAAARAQSLCDAVKNNVLYTMVVEPSGKCNLACTFCDLHSGRIEGTEPLKGQMSEETFTRLADQLAAMPFVLKEMQFHGNGEPLLNKKFPDFVRYAKSRGVAQKCRLTTNGTMLTPKNLEKVIEAGIDEIHVSLDIVDRQGYEDLKGRDLYEKVDANLEYAIDYMERHARCALFIKYAPPHRDGDYNFTKEIADAVVEKYRTRVEHSNVIHLKALPLVTLLDGKTKQKREYNSACEFPFFSMFTKCDGRVSVCCADLFSDLELGNVNDTTISEMLNGEVLRRIRRIHLSGDLRQLPLCLYCGNRTAVNMRAIGDDLKKHIERPSGQVTCGTVAAE
jgi:sulfatase maturation enzyme AslB (radical SAM superfamily)